ncbi:MAG: anaerobic ribonucleoside-triphosphate reductase [Sulfuricurvum sp.]
MKPEEILKQHEAERTRCIVYTRVMGYHRPVESFNIGKKQEHKERRYFDERHLRHHSV